MEVLLTRWCWGWIRQATHPVEHEFFDPVVVVVEVLPDDVLAGWVGRDGVERRLVHVLLQRHREDLRPQFLQFLRLLLDKNTVFENNFEGFPDICRCNILIRLHYLVHIRGMHKWNTH